MLIYTKKRGPHGYMCIRYIIYHNLSKVTEASQIYKNKREARNAIHLLSISCARLGILMPRLPGILDMLCSRAANRDPYSSK